jgi:hypothetical protein
MELTIQMCPDKYQIGHLMEPDNGAKSTDRRRRRRTTLDTGFETDARADHGTGVFGVGLGLDGADLAKTEELGPIEFDPFMGGFHCDYGDYRSEIIDGEED